MEATHFLESQRQVTSAGSKSSSAWKPLTYWRAKDRCCQQGSNQAHHRSCSPTGEPRTGIVSRVQIHLTVEDTHRLESQGQVSLAGQNPAHHGSHSHPEGPRTGTISRVQIQLTMEATHILESRGQVS